LSTTYKVVAGDTFSLIARKEYGAEDNADLIARANPGLLEPLTPGISIIIPLLPTAPKDLIQQADSDNIDEVAILIDKNRFRFWSNIRITRAIDSMDTVSFLAPFQSDMPGFRTAFRPFEYKDVDITVGGQSLFTGTMVAVDPDIENDRRTIAVNSYALPGVLNDCMVPASMSDKLEFKGQGLQEIATTLVAPFGLSVEFRDDQGAIFGQVATKSNKTILSFLIDLAKQRNLIISSTPRGALLFWKSVELGTPVARLQQGESPVLSISAKFNPQGYYSHITGMEPTSVGLSGSQFTVKNPRLEGVIRPFTFKLKDTKTADVKTGVEAKAGRMFANTAAYSIVVDTWRDPAGNLWEPNTTITLIAPDAMIYNDYEFIVRSVEFNRDRDSETAILDLVIPGSFSGQIPELLPWDE